MCVRERRIRVMCMWVPPRRPLHLLRVPAAGEGHLSVRAAAPAAGAMSHPVASLSCVRAGGVRVARAERSGRTRVRTERVCGELCGVAPCACMRVRVCGSGVRARARTCIPAARDRYNFSYIT